MCARSSHGFGRSTRALLSADAKARLTDGRDAFGVHGIDPGARRTGVTPVDHSFDRGRRSFELRFHCTVGAVADEAAHAERARLVLATVPEPHTLHAGGDDHADADRIRQT